VKDSYRHKGLRKKLIEGLRTKGISDKKVLDAMLKIPRHFFLDKAFEDWAYKDVPFPIGSDQTISQPYTVAYQTALLNVSPKMKILEIGTGSGYQACVLSEMGAKVYSLERQESLFLKTNQLLKRLGFERIRTFLRDGFEGLPRFAPFDRILVTAGAEDIPIKLTEQLAIDGILVIPVGSYDAQKMLRIKRLSDDRYDQDEFGLFRFVPFMKGIHPK
jgi:protein-L-isoaspartate(D-aspartate) O-methyltransferase